MNEKKESKINKPQETHAGAGAYTFTYSEKLYKQNWRP